MNEDEKFRLQEHEIEKDEIINSAPHEIKDTYLKLVTELDEIGINSPIERANFLTFWLGVEFQNVFSNVLNGDLREGKYFQFICSTIEELIKNSFKEPLPITWTLSSVMKEIAEDSMRLNRSINNHK